MFQPSGKRINLLDDNGIDLLGNTIEPSPPLSMNFNHYGSLHNFGHVSSNLTLSNTLI